MHRPSQVVLVCVIVTLAASTSEAQVPTKPAAKKEATTATAASAKPATPDQAAKVLDLRTFPVMSGAKVSGKRTLGSLTYEVAGAPTAAFDFQKRELLKRDFKELPGGYRDPKNVSGAFSREGYYVRVSASEGYGDPKAELASVSIINEGNVDLRKLPVPSGATPFFPETYRASYTTNVTVADAAAACRKLLLAAGWEPYGQNQPVPAGNGVPESSTSDFKKNAIRLHCFVQRTPVGGGTTVINYSTDLLSVDLPCPPDTLDPRYDDGQKALTYNSPKAQADTIVAFYQQRLSGMGWKATTEKPVSDSRTRTQFLVFRNEAKELLSLDLEEFSDVVRVKLKHQTAAELSDENKRAAELAAKKKTEEAERNRKVAVVVPVIANAKSVEKVRENVWEITVPTGGGIAALENLRKHYLKDGWTEEKGVDLGKNAADVLFKKGMLEIRCGYFETGITDAELTLRGGANVILEESRPNQKPTAEKAPAAKPMTKSPLPGLELPAGVELPDDVKVELEKAAKELQKALPPKPAPKK